MRFTDGTIDDPAQAYGFYVNLYRYPTTDTTLIDYNLGALGYLRVKMTPTGHVILEQLVWGGLLQVDMANAAVPLNTPVYISFMNHGRYGDGDLNYQGAIYLPDSSQLGSFFADSSLTSRGGATDTYIAQFGWGVSTSSDYANFPQNLGWMSKFRSFVYLGVTPTPPTSDTSGDTQDYMLRQSTGSANEIADSGTGRYTLAAGPEGITINRTGPYPSMYMPVTLPPPTFPPFGSESFSGSGTADNVPYYLDHGVNSGFGGISEGLGFFLHLARYPTEDTTIVDYQLSTLGDSGYLRIKLTPAGHAVLEMAAKEASLSYDLAQGALPLSTTVYISFINIGGYGEGRFFFDGAVYTAGGGALNTFRAYSSQPNPAYGEFLLYNARFGLGVSRSSQYANFTPDLGWMSKFRAFRGTSYPYMPDADAPANAYDLQDYMVRQPLGPAAQLDDSSGNHHDLSPGPAGITINLDGPYVSRFAPVSEPPTRSEVLSPSEHHTTCATSKPVNCATGDFYHTFDDLSVPGRGVPLHFARTYYSLNATQEGTLGFGWTDNYNMYLTTDSTGTITVTEEPGSSITFHPISGGYQASGRVLAALVDNHDGTLTFTRNKDQIQYVFTTPTTAAVGLLQEEIDRNGYATVLHYANGKLANVTDPANRALTFSYTASGRIARVSDPIGRTVAFTYNAADELVAASDVGGGVTQFTYDSGTHLLRTMTDPNGGSVVNNYDANGRVITQTDALSRTTAFTYTMNGDGSQTSVITSPTGSVTVEQYRDNEMQALIQGYGTTQAATSTYTYDPFTLGVSSVTDPDGHTSYNTYDPRGNLLSHSDALNRTTSYAYDAFNDTTAITDPLGNATSMTYDTNGNLLSTSRALAHGPAGATTAGGPMTLARQPHVLLAGSNGESIGGSRVPYGRDSRGTRSGQSGAIRLSTARPQGTAPHALSWSGSRAARGGWRISVLHSSADSGYQYEVVGALLRAEAVPVHAAAHQRVQVTHAPPSPRRRTPSRCTPAPTIPVGEFIVAPKVIIQGNDGRALRVTVHGIGRYMPSGRHALPGRARIHLAWDAITVHGRWRMGRDLGLIPRQKYGTNTWTVTVPHYLVTHPGIHRISVFIVFPNGHTTDSESGGRLIAGRRAGRGYLLVQGGHVCPPTPRPTPTATPTRAPTTTAFPTRGSMSTETATPTSAVRQPTRTTAPSPVPPSTATPTSTGTPTLPSNAASPTPTVTSISPATVVPSTSPTALPPTGTSTATTLPAMVTATPSRSATDTFVPATATDTPRPPTSTDTATPVPTTPPPPSIPCSQAGPYTATVCLTYDPAHPGDVVARTDPNGHTTRYTYDANGDLAGVSDPLGDTTTYGYDLIGRKTSIVHPLGNVAGANPISYTTTMTYSAFGETTAMTDAQGNVTTFGYDQDQNLIMTTDALGRQTIDGYNLDNERTSVTRPDGVVLQTGYDEAGNVITTTDGLSQSTSFAYDALNRLISTTAPLGRTTVYTYDLAGNKTATTDPLSQTTTYTYNEANELVGVRRPDGTSPTTGYDLDGRVSMQTDGRGSTTSYGYDSLDRTVAVTDGLGRVTAYGYDLAGNRTALTDPMGRTTAYAYDAANRLASIAYSDGSTSTVQYSYDADGDRTAMRDGTGTTRYTYDTLDRTTTVVDGSGQVVGYRYNQVGEPITLIYPGGKQVARAYDTLGRVTGVTDWLGHTTAFGYDGNGNVVSETYPNASSAVISYNAASDMTGITDTVNGALHWTFGYERNALGQMSGVRDGINGSAHTYGYDNTHRLTSDSGPGGTQGWAYDAADNLAAITTTAGTRAFAYDQANELTVLIATTGAATVNVPYAYNADGDRTGQGNSEGGASAAFEWDQANRLITATVGTTVTANYAYDGDGLRVSKTVTATNGVTTTAETWETITALPQLLQAGNMRYITGPLGPIEQVDASNTPTYYYQDQLGSTRGLVDGSGTTVGTYSYDPYGNVTEHTGVSTPLQYAGQYTDAETGLQYLRARYYDPVTAQFLSRDPLVVVTGQAYIYTGDNPLNAVDPTGLYRCYPLGPDPCDMIVDGARQSLQTFQGEVDQAENNVGRGVQGAIRDPRGTTIRVLHAVSGTSATVATGTGSLALTCSVAAAAGVETGPFDISAVGCAAVSGTVSTVATGVGATADVGLALLGNGSGKDLAIDAIGLGTMGLAKYIAHGLEGLEADARTKALADVIANAHAVPTFLIPFLPNNEGDSGCATK